MPARSSSSSRTGDMQGAPPFVVERRDALSECLLLSWRGLSGRVLRRVLGQTATRARQLLAAGHLPTVVRTVRRADLGRRRACCQDSQREQPNEDRCDRLVSCHFPCLAPARVLKAKSRGPAGHMRTGARPTPNRTVPGARDPGHRVR
jgi:hypothetical protein